MAGKVVERVTRALSRAALVLFDWLLPAKGGRVVIHSVPDFDDNVIALLSSAPTDCEIVVLCNDVDSAVRRSRFLNVGHSVRLIDKKSIRSLYQYLTAELAISTHGLFGTTPRSKGKKHIGVWHGDAIKANGTMIGERSKHFTYAIACSSLHAAIRAVELGIPVRNVKVMLSPRAKSLMAMASSEPRVQKPPDELWVLWAPTYRRSEYAKREDGSFETLNSIPTEAFAKLSPRIRLWRRDHPMSVASNCPGDATDQELENSGLSFYQLLAHCDVLITDYSSLWMDYLLLDRPIIGFCPDLDEYASTRGLIFQPYSEWFPGPVCDRWSEVLIELAAIMSGEDAWSHVRSSTRSRMIANNAGEFWAEFMV